MSRPSGVRKLTLHDLSDDELKGRRVLVRVDFNVPLDEDGTVDDDTRLRRTLPTLRRLVGAGARTILLSHLGRPGGEPDLAFGLEPVARRLGELTGREVGFVPEPVGDRVAERVRSLDEGDVLVLENTRFHPGEKADDPELAAAWAELGDLYVGDAFGAAHRAHASTAGLPKAIRDRGGRAVAGVLMDEELRFLDGALRDPERPYVGVLGGAKISGKIDVVEALLDRVDRLLVGGAMANTFFRALGLEVGRSLVEDDRLGVARSVLEAAGEKLVLPADVVVADRIEDGTETRVRSRDEIRPDEAAGDVGPATRAVFREVLSGARTAVWNGPLGVFEIDAFAEGTLDVARAFAEATERGALTIVGGGDSASAVEKAGVADRIRHVSTGGGASLELLSGVVLPGVEALSDAPGSNPPSSPA